MRGQSEALWDADAQTKQRLFLKRRSRSSGLSLPLSPSLLAQGFRAAEGLELAVEPAGVALDDEGVEDGRGLVPLLYVLVVLVPRGVS